MLGNKNRMFFRDNPMWIFILVIVIGTAIYWANREQPEKAEVVVTCNKVLLYSFWVVIIGVLIYLDYFMLKDVWKKIREEYKRNLDMVDSIKKILSTFFFKYLIARTRRIDFVFDFFFFLIFLVIGLESAILINFDNSISIFLLLLGLFSTIILIFVDPEYRFRYGLADNIRTMIPVVLILTASFDFATTTFFNKAECVDKTFFSNIAAYHGDNYSPILKKRVRELGKLDDKKISFENRLEYLNFYNYRLKNDTLDTSLYPEIEIINGKTVNTILLLDSFERLDIDDFTDKSKIGRVFSTFLDYLCLIIQKENREGVKYIDKINVNSNHINLLISDYFFKIFMRELKRAKLSKEYFDQNIKAKLKKLSDFIAESSINVDLRLFEYEEAL